MYASSRPLLHRTLQTERHAFLPSAAHSHGFLPNQLFLPGAPLPILPAAERTADAFAQASLLVHSESIITSLVLEHVLRIRLKAELPQAEANSGGEVEAAAATAAVREGEEAVTSTHERNATATGSGSEDRNDEHARPETSMSTATAATIVSVAASSTTQGEDADAKKAGVDGNKRKTEVQKDGKSGNLTGRINNLVTSDLSNITNGRNILYLCEPPF